MTWTLLELENVTDRFVCHLKSLVGLGTFNSQDIQLYIG